MMSRPSFSARPLPTRPKAPNPYLRRYRIPDLVRSRGVFARLRNKRRAVANQHQIGEGAADVGADAIAGTRHASMGYAEDRPGDKGTESHSGEWREARAYANGDGGRMGRDMEGHRLASGRRVRGSGRGVDRE